MYYAAEDVTIANNLLKAKLHSSNHVTPLIPPCSQVEELLLIKPNIIPTILIGQKLAVKFRRRKERKLKHTPDKTATAQAAQQKNDDGQERNLRVGHNKSLAEMLKTDDAKLDEEIRQINDIPGTPHNAGTTVPTLHTHEESVRPLVHPPLHASSHDVAVELADGLDERAEEDLRQQLRQATIEGRVPTAIVDTGASASCVQPTNEQPTSSECGRFKWIDPTFTTTGTKSSKVFQMALGHVANAADVVHLNLPLREEATEAHTVPGLRHNLLSMNKLAKAGYEAKFSGDNVQFYDARGTQREVTRQAVLEGWYVPEEGLWRIPLACRSAKSITNIKTDTCFSDRSPLEILGDSNQPPIDQICNVYDLKVLPEVIAYYHAAAGFPTKPTWVKAIRNGHYSSWIGLTAKAADKHFPQSDETWQGHGRKTKSGLRSTKMALNDEQKHHPITKKRPEKVIYQATYDLHNDLERKMYTDQTGRFPVRSFRGMQYIMVLYEVDSNAILVQSMRNRTSGEMVAAYEVLVKRLKTSGFEPKLHLLDNECSKEYKDTIANNGMKLQLVPPNDHRRNIAEKAIQTFKDHFVSVLCGTDAKFPMQLWCRILRQAEHQLNLLRKSRVDPSMSTYEALYGKHNYDQNPWAPLGCAVELHVTPNKRKTWGKHTKTGYYLGNATEHYRCHEIWTVDTRSVRIGQTVFFKHKYLTQPRVTESDALLRASDELCAALKDTVTPVKGGTRRAVDMLMDIFKNVAKSTVSPEDKCREARTNAANTRVTNEESEPISDWIPAEATEIDEAEIWNDDVRSSASMTIKHGTTRHSNHPPAKNTRYTQREKLLSAVDLSGSCPSAQQCARRRFPMKFLTDYAGTVLDKSGELLEYRHLIKRPEYKEAWGHSFGNEIGRLAQGMPGRNKGTNTLFFIHKHDVPPDRWKDMTYARIVCNVRPQKAETNRTRLTMGGDKINVPMDCGTPTANLLTVKLLLNSVVSTPGAKFLGLDLKDFYLNTPMDRPEFLRMKIETFPEDVIAHYKLREKVDEKGFLFIRVERGMYGLPHAGIIAQKLLEERLAKHGYHQSDKTPGLWTHIWRPISFSLIVDDFGVKYVGKEHADHLIKILEENYVVDKDWEGKKYCGISLDFNYKKRQVHLSMPGYCDEALRRFQHECVKWTDQPHKHVIPTYGATIQYAKDEDNTEKLGAAATKFIQQVTGTFLYYARAVDATMLVALSAIASEQASPTKQTMEKTKKFLDYVASHPDAILTYSASNMVLNVHSDASYLTEPKARSRAGGHFFLSDNSEDPSDNGAVLDIAQIIKNVMSSAAEAEIGALFINSRQAIPARVTVEELGHIQPPTPIQTDNTTALGFVSKNLQPKATKSADMRYWWMRDRADQKQFRYYWGAGKNNRADYYTKHFCEAHHRETRPKILTPRKVLNALRIGQGKKPHIFRLSSRVC